MKRKILVDGKLIEASISTEYKCRLKSKKKIVEENSVEFSFLCSISTGIYPLYGINMQDD